MSLTQSQYQAVKARGNVLVMAGAGTGKTRTLVERALDCLLNESPTVSLDELLLVTFTEAAAAEIRHRIRKGLESQLEASGDSARWQEQLALFETAQIGTLHSFCLRLIRQHFYELELDPEFVVMPEEESRLLAEETLDDLLDEHYRGTAPLAAEVRELIESHGRSSDRQVRRLVLRLHDYTQTRPNPDRWFHRQFEALDSHDPTCWKEWLLEAVSDLCASALADFQPVRSSNAVAAACVESLQKLPAKFSREQAAMVVKDVIDAFENCPRGKKGLWVTPYKNLREQFEFLASLLPAHDGKDPLAEDWHWMRSPASTLLRLTLSFTEKYSERKRELGAVDFHDLEQHALALLWDPEKDAPTAVAREWQRRLRYIFVDEYQDINAAQDTIILSLSRPGEGANRFLVGDVKQSIYRFRLADPYIFQSYARDWGKVGATISLQENFRSEPAILQFVNSVFSPLMRSELGGIAYDDQAVLKPGGDGAADSEQEPRVELHFRTPAASGNHATEEGESGDDELEDLEAADKEARLVCSRARELMASGYAIRDPEDHRLRPVEWRDIAILLRSPSNKAECYAKEFARQNVPLVVARGGFYDSLEVSDILSLLQILDNPLQDIPLLAVLRSPIVGLSVDELATIRMTCKGRFWLALTSYHEAASSGSASADPLAGKVGRFLESYASWRRMAREISLCRCLQTVLAETHYESWLLTQDRGEQRRANIQRLLTLARKFDRFQRQGLFRFLRFIEAQREADAEPPGPVVTSQNAVRVLSIHQSKGLEFPVVVLADLAKTFNEQDLRAGIILDEKYGVCAQIRSPQSGSTYPSLSHWLARKRQSRELRGEELRLLYVALTRARDLLILTGTLNQTKADALWEPQTALTTDAIARGRSFADWIVMWFSVAIAPGTTPANQGASPLLRWHFTDDADLDPNPQPLPSAEFAQDLPNEDAIAALMTKLEWRYPYPASTTTPAKTSVTTLRRGIVDTEIGPTPPLLPVRFELESERPARPPARRGDPAEIGNANHRFLQLVALGATADEDELRAEAKRLCAAGRLTLAEAELLDFPGLAAFWQSELGHTLRAKPDCLRRELAFTVRLSLAEVDELAGRSLAASVDEDFVVVQGVVDLAVILPQELWILDFKTDRVAGAAIPERAQKYEPQLRAYAMALSRIYNRPATRAWLYFLTPRQLVPVALMTPGS
jgi:ATP-dependent helicase/nuclease subunit A